MNFATATLKMYYMVDASFAWPSDYINNFKLETAKGMLEQTQLSISEIAYRNGFSSPNYFSTVFKNKYGITPNAYRKSSE